MKAISKVPFHGATDLLSPREREVLFLLARGLSNKEMASRMGLSTRTIDRHIASMFIKMQVNSRTRAVLKALRQGWLCLQDIVDVQ
jgi:DNA-binding NarL/FixJ family response regulator